MTRQRPPFYFFKRHWELCSSSLVFAVALVFGYLVSPIVIESVPVTNLPDVEMSFGSILTNNLVVMFMVVAGGLFVSIPSVIVVSVNASLMGMFFGIFPLSLFVLHFPLEAGAMILALAASFRFSKGIFDWIKHGKSKLGKVWLWMGVMVALTVIGVVIECAEVGAW